MTGRSEVSSDEGYDLCWYTTRVIEMGRKWGTMGQNPAWFNAGLHFFGFPAWHFLTQHIMQQMVAATFSVASGQKSVTLYPTSIEPGPFFGQFWPDTPCSTSTRGTVVGPADAGEPGVIHFLEVSSCRVGGGVKTAYTDAHALTRCVFAGARQKLAAWAIGSRFAAWYTWSLHHAEAGSSGLSPLEISGPHGTHCPPKGCAIRGNCYPGAAGFLCTVIRLESVVEIFSCRNHFPELSC